ncbi:MAG: hypothetical protein V4612_04155 [Pseudomonadota bacterium]
MAEQTKPIATNNVISGATSENETEQKQPQTDPTNDSEEAAESETKQKSWLELLLEKMLGKKYSEQVGYDEQTGQFKVTIQGGNSKMLETMAGLMNMLKEDAQDNKRSNDAMKMIGEMRENGELPTMADMMEDPSKIGQAKDGFEKIGKVLKGEDLGEQKSGATKDNSRPSIGHFTSMVNQRAASQNQQQGNAL